MRTFGDIHVGKLVLGLYMTFVLAGETSAQNKGIRFLAEPAFHDELHHYGYVDAFQARANAFVFEGKHDEYFKWEKQLRRKAQRAYKAVQKKMKKTKDEDVRDSLFCIYKEQYSRRNQLANPYPRHNYVVIIRPSFSPTCGFAVEKDKLVYMGIVKSDLKKSSIKFDVNASDTDVSQEFAEAMRSLMDNIVYSASVSDRMYTTLDGTTYDILTGPFPTHMVKSEGGGNNDEGAVCHLLEKLCEAAKNNDSQAINAQLSETKRLDAIYRALRDNTQGSLP